MYYTGGICLFTRVADLVSVFCRSKSEFSAIFNLLNKYAFFFFILVPFSHFKGIKYEWFLFNYYYRFTNSVTVCLLGCAKILYANYHIIHRFAVRFHCLSIERPLSTYTSLVCNFTVKQRKKKRVFFAEIILNVEF